MNKIILLNAIVGSQAYGTNTPDSDIDTKGVYLQDPMEVLGMEYKEQINLDKDACLYEVRRFLQLLCNGNPTMLELLYIPEDCILEKHPLFEDSDLPHSVDPDLVKSILNEIRKESLNLF